MALRQLEPGRPAEAQNCSVAMVGGPIGSIWRSSVAALTQPAVPQVELLHALDHIAPQRREHLCAA